MTLEEYQKRAMTTCMASSENFSYMFLNLVGEVGEFASKVAKAIRKEENCIEYNDLGVTVTNNEELQKDVVLRLLHGLQHGRKGIFSQR